MVARAAPCLHVMNLQLRAFRGGGMQCQISFGRPSPNKTRVRLVRTNFLFVITRLRSSGNFCILSKGDLGYISSTEQEFPERVMAPRGWNNQGNQLDSRDATVRTWFHDVKLSKMAFRAPTYGLYARFLFLKFISFYIPSSHVSIRIILG